MRLRVFVAIISPLLIVPSGSLELLPSSNTLSVGKVITWSGPAMAMGGLLFSLHPSQDVSFLQERLNAKNILTIEAIRKVNILFKCFMIYIIKMLLLSPDNRVNFIGKRDAIREIRTAAYINSIVCAYCTNVHA